MATREEMDVVLAAALPDIQSEQEAYKQQNGKYKFMPSFNGNPDIFVHEHKRSDNELGYTVYALAGDFQKSVGFGFGAITQDWIDVSEE